MIRLAAHSAKQNVKYSTWPKKDMVYLFLTDLNTFYEQELLHSCLLLYNYTG